MEAAEGTDLLVVVTEWNEFRAISPERLRQAMRGDLIVDLRNMYEKAAMQNAASDIRASDAPDLGSVMKYLTDFADQAVLLPLAGVVAVALAASPWWRGPAGWLLATAGALGTMAFMKYVCFACPGPLRGTGIASPSGHPAASAAIYGRGSSAIFRVGLL